MSDRKQGNGKAGASEERALARQELKAALATARTARQKLDALISSPHAAALVPTFPAEDLYFTIKEVGLSDSVDLVQLTSPSQFRTFIDLDAWQRDQFAQSNALLWLRAARTDEDEERYRKKLAGLDMEVLELLLKRLLKVHDLQEDEDPELAGPTYRSPEGRYLVEFEAEGADYAGIKGLLDDLYAEDPFKAARLLEAVRWELASELEETAFRWRIGRLADQGFPDLAEALSYFAYLDPDAGLPPLEKAPAVPEAFFLARLGPAGRFFDRAVALVPDPQRGILERQLVTVLNAVMVVESVDPGELEQVRRAIESARDTLSLGLEHASRGDAERAALLLVGAPLKRIFQIGVSLALKLKFRADRLMKSGHAAFAGASGPLFDPPLAEVVTALRRKRPLYSVSLEKPSSDEPRAFRERADLERAGAALERAELLADLMREVGFRAEPASKAFAQGPAADVAPLLRFSDLYVTAVAREAAGAGLSFEPLPRGSLDSVAARIFSPEAKVTADFQAQLRGPIEAAGARLSPKHLEEARRFAEHCARRIEDELGSAFAASHKLEPALALPIVVA